MKPANVARRRRTIRRTLLAIAGLACIAPTRSLHAQGRDSTIVPARYWRGMAAGAATSILTHELAHIATALALGGHISFGFDKARPTVYSGLDATAHPHEQFLFSASGLVAQSLLDEALLDVPHDRGGAFERGLLGGGIGTTLFYLTIGRRGSVSDVDFMARTHAMTITQVTLLFGSVAALHTWRVHRDRYYANFFARPSADGRVRVGLSVQP